MAQPRLCVTGAFLAMLSLSWALPAVNRTQRVHYTGHRLVSVTPKTPAHASLLSALENRLRADVWQDANYLRPSELVRLRPEVAGEFVTAATQSGMTVTTLTSNVQELIDDERKEMRFTTYSTEKSRFERYLKYKEFKSALKEYAKTYDHVKFTSIGRSYEGRDLIGVHIKAKKNLPIVFFECGIHPREWIAPATCLYIIDQLATQYDKDEDIKSLVSKYEWRIYPLVNPDGYEYSHNTDRLWRKTRSKSRVNSECYGADANRNFDIGDFCKHRSSNDPCSEEYCGDKPFSEPEVRAIRDALKDIKGRTEFYFAMHSFGLLWMFPYAYAKTPSADHELLVNISQRATEAIESVRRTHFDIGPISRVMYQSSGSSLDWAYDRAGIKKSFVLELEPSSQAFDWKKAFMLSPREILGVAKETWEGIKAAVA
ncbi:zinc carboxypeptidase-like [Amblyomma americanum]